MPKRKLLGCSFPVLVGISVVFLLLFAVGIISGPVGQKIFGDLGLPFALPQPEPHLPAAEIFTVFGFSITNTIFTAWITVAFLVVVSFFITRSMKIVPGRLQGAFELLMGWLYDFCQRVAGEENGRRFFPIVATIFLFVMFNAWLSLLPGFGSLEIVNSHGHHVHLLRGANTDINTPFALAIISFLFVWFYGLKSLGIRYLAKFFNIGQLFKSLGQVFRGKLKAGLSGMFTGFINIFVGILELVSELIRIVSFTFRLFGNMTAGELLLLFAAFLVPWIAALPFYGLELLVGFVQALIFGGLTLVFLTLATAHHGGESAHQ